MQWCALTSLRQMIIYILPNSVFSDIRLVAGNQPWESSYPIEIGKYYMSRIFFFSSESWLLNFGHHITR